MLAGGSTFKQLLPRCACLHTWYSSSVNLLQSWTSGLHGRAIPMIHIDNSDLAALSHLLNGP